MGFRRPATVGASGHPDEQTGEVNAHDFLTNAVSLIRAGNQRFKSSQAACGATGRTSPAFSMLTQYGAIG